MKIKYYLRGLGTGIIFTAIVLMIIYSYRTTDSKTIERARELGMIMPEEASKQAVKDKEKNTGNNSTGDLSSEENTENNEDENTSGSEGNSDTPEQTSQNNGGEENTTVEPVTSEPPTEEPTTENQTNAGREITFTISGGMYSETVSQRLNELGVIDDAAGFNRYLVENGYAGKIRIGTYTFTTGMSYADVAAIISR